MAVTRSDSEMAPEPDMYESDFAEIDALLEGDNGEDKSPKELLGGIKQGLVEEFIYSEVMEDVAPEVMESLRRELPGNPSEAKVVEAIKNGGEHGEGEFYERILEFAVNQNVEGNPDFGYESVISQVSPHLAETVEQEMDDPSPSRVAQALGNAEVFGGMEFYQEAVEAAQRDEAPNPDALEESMFDDKIELSDAFGADYILRGGKRLRPFMTMLTEFGLEDGVSYKSAMVGAAQEIIHASSLEHDDDMDDDTLRRGKLSSERVNRALHGDGSWKQSVLDGNKVEAWGNEALNSIIDDPSEEFEGIPKTASGLFYQMEAELNDGQKRDIDMEDQELRHTQLDDYENMIAGKTGALFKSGVNIIVEDHLSRADYTPEEEDRVRGLFDQYMTSFNRLFQAGDDAIEVFRPGESGKSVTDVDNRKLTFPAIQTKDYLLEEDGDYAELFMNIFDGAYDEVTEEMRETAAEMHEEAEENEEVLDEVYEDPEEMSLEIPDDADAYGEWEEDWITHAIRMYGKEPSESKATEYMKDAREAVEELYDMGVINESARERYEQFADFVWNRDH
jgi:geranylgeranyl pyrophosphate synthase